MIYCHNQFNLVKSLNIYYSVQIWTTFNTKYDHWTTVPQ